MTDTTHTPGPWRVLHKRGVYPMNSESLSIGTAEQYRKEHEANARLMAEAPNLLAALRDAALQIEYLHDKFQKTGSGNAVLFTINAAIARATDAAA